jgi:ribonucleoside-diphosphate reductase alpha chain
VATQVRALDNVLDVTFWPLPQQQPRKAKRRIGVGFTGMGNTLAMLCLRYDSPKAAPWPRALPSACATPPTRLGGAGARKGRLPQVRRRGLPGQRHLRQPPARRAAGGIRQHGIRNSHLLSIAPTGTVSLAFADNASNGIEPPFSWMYKRKKREADGSTQRVRRGRPRLAAVPRAGRRREPVARRTSSRRWR